MDQRATKAAGSYFQHPFRKRFEDGSDGDAVMAADASRASKRRKCARKAGPAPSAVHYVGYVEDDETPESIARKFEELERIEAAARQAGAAAPATGHQHSADGGDLDGSFTADGGLTDEQLKEVSTHQEMTPFWVVLRPEYTAAATYNGLSLIDHK